MPHELLLLITTPLMRTMGFPSPRVRRWSLLVSTSTLDGGGCGPVVTIATMKWRDGSRQASYKYQNLVEQTLVAIGTINYCLCISVYVLCEISIVFINLYFHKKFY